MNKYLIIAEKPSVATDLSKALASRLGKFSKKGKSRDSQYFENDNAAITSAVGHLVELKMPTGKNGKSLPWNFSALPAIPEKFELQPIERTESRLKHVLSLARKKEFNVIINACDAGREGELIFQYIIEIGKIQKPVQRLWMRSMTTEAIVEAWDKLIDGDKMAHLADAAKCRSEADWLVGLNSTRALTCFRSRHGGFNITAAGRVQTPTLAILAVREREIQTFNPEDYYEVHADFSVSKGSYPSKWIDTAFKKDATKPRGRTERIWDKAQAETIQYRCQGKIGTVSEENKPARQIAPQLYDLTTLQREAPFTAKKTLAITQALYERHKMVTYPRTDSRYLPEDYMGKVNETIRAIANSNLGVSKWASDAINNKRIQFSKRIFNNAKVSDHFAIIPTGRNVKLSDQEAKIYDMIVKRFIAVFFPPAEFQTTRRVTTINHGSETDTFLSTGKTLIKPGYLAVYGRVPGVAAAKDELVAVTQGEAAQAETVELLEKETAPPARYTESTLLSSMEGAGKLIDDDEQREAMSERGLGTPATRAAIIEGLLRQKYIAREGRELNVTGKGLRLIELCEEMHIEQLTSPSMTGDWEAKLNKMERGEIERKAFMHEIIGFTKDVVGRAHGHMEKLIHRSFPDLKCPCPSCDAEHLKQTDATYECTEETCNFRLSKHIAGRRLIEEEACELFKTRKLSERDGFVSRFNKPFSASLELVQTVSKTGKLGKWKTNFVFDDDAGLAEDDAEKRLLKPVGLKSGETVNVYETDKFYVLPDFKPEGSPEGFRIGKMILSKRLEFDTIESLLSQGKTPLLNGFISKRTKRPFSARLTLDFDQGKIGFEFEPRPAKKSAKR